MTMSYRPTPTATRICLSCGSPSPEHVEPDCTHPEVAHFSELPGEVRDLVVKLRRAKSYLSASLVTLREAARMEQSAGRAIVDRQNAIEPPPANVRLLRPRPELVGRGPSPAAEPSPASKSAPPARPAPSELPSWSLTAPTPPRKRGTRAKGSKLSAPALPTAPRRRAEPADDADLDLFAAVDPSTGERP